MQCTKCGKEAPLYEVNFQQNIGLIIMHIRKACRGLFCKKCVQSTFWSTFLTNLFLGWWGIKSFFYTGYFLITNTVQFIKLGKLKSEVGTSVISSAD